MRLVDVEGRWTCIFQRHGSVGICDLLLCIFSVGAEFLYYFSSCLTLTARERQAKNIYLFRAIDIRIAPLLLYAIVTKPDNDDIIACYDQQGYPGDRNKYLCLVKKRIGVYTKS